MAQREETNQGDVISRLADAGEDAVRQLVELPRRTVAGALHRIEERVHAVEGQLHSLATRLRAIDPLEGRVAAIEKRLDGLEKPRPRRKPARTASTRAKPLDAGAAIKAAAIESEHGEADVGRQHARAVSEPERAEASAQKEGNPAG